jgi:hypothetical protein
MYTFSCFCLSVLILTCHCASAYQKGFTAIKMSINLDTGKNLGTKTISSWFMPRRSFFSAATVSTGAMLVINGPVAHAATPQIQTSSGLGVKYAITEDVPPGSTKRRPQRGDIVAIEYTGYTSDGTVRHSKESFVGISYFLTSNCHKKKLNFLQYIFSPLLCDTFRRSIDSMIRIIKL